MVARALCVCVEAARARTHKRGRGWDAVGMVPCGIALAPVGREGGHSRCGGCGVRARPRTVGVLGMRQSLLSGEVRCILFPSLCPNPEIKTGKVTPGQDLCSV